MADVVSSVTRVTFGKNTETYQLPDTVVIDPNEILDETEGVYRVSIGAMNDAAEVYQRLFITLERNMPFVENMHIWVDKHELVFRLAYVSKLEKPYGTFFDIEAATRKDLKYIERN